VIQPCALLVGLFSAYDSAQVEGKGMWILELGQLWELGQLFKACSGDTGVGAALGVRAAFEKRVQGVLLTSSMMCSNLSYGAFVL
jgi:hypothetical protein